MCSIVMRKRLNFRSIYTEKNRKIKDIRIIENRYFITSNTEVLPFAWLPPLWYIPMWYSGKISFFQNTICNHE